MASVYGLRNALSTKIYEHIKVYEGVDNIGFCGWGVRDRGGDLATGDTILCQNWAARAGSSVGWVRFRTGAYAGGAGTIKFSFWQKGPSAILYTRVGVVTITEADISMAADTEYIYALDTPITFSSVSGTTCLMAAYTTGAIQLDYTANTGSSDARAVTADASLSTTYDWDAGAGVSDQPFAVSAEAFDEPASWDQVLDGGAITEINTDWENVLYCTSADWTDPANIYDGDPATFAVSTNGNGSAIYIDLGMGTTPAEAWSRENVFPDYSAYGVRAVYKLTITGSIAANGGISISYSDSDTAVAPVAGWETIHWNDTLGAMSDTVTIPVVARWLKLTEVGTSVLDRITEFQVETILYRVTDGKFYVESSQDPNIVWVESYPTEDKVYSMTIANVAGAESPKSDPITNRRYKD